jgi:putative ATPase
MDLFAFQAAERARKNAPLADRMRPRTLEEFIGQEAIIGPGRLLRRAITADRLSSIILYGPPGSGKTTLAQVIANTTAAHFEELNAVSAGVADVRRIVEQARERLALTEQRTVVFIDEIHRFNKGQQDALLPAVERAIVVLIGATTENPFFSINAPLLSRSRVFRLESLGEDELRQVAAQALADQERGLGGLNIQLDDEALMHLIRSSAGDARGMLNAIEMAALSTPPGEDGVIHIDMHVAEESIQQRVVLYDKSGDRHYDVISAFIKSMRGGDPDAALYWLACMVKAGEDPRFIARRIMICASEDVGNADPRALQVAVSAAQAVEMLGMPEGRIPLAQAVVYVASAPKSNASYLGVDSALAHIETGASLDVPMHLRDASYKSARKLGHGKGYDYPHSHPGAFVPQQYLPDGIKEQQFYNPTDYGYEKHIRERLRHWWGNRWK